MFEKGELVRYGGSGVCRIEEKTTLEMAGSTQEYFVLSPLFKSGVLYVPCANEELVGRILPLLTPEEIEKVILQVSERQTDWIRDFRRRSESAKKALQSGDRADALYLIKSFWARRIEQNGEGKRIHTTDDYFLRDAQSLIFSEFSYVLGKSVEEVEKEIRERFGMKEA